MYIEVNKINDSYINNPRLRELIIDLKCIVDDLSYQYGKFKDMILELANRLDKEKLCEQNKISQVIKDILKDKIMDGKISSKWIEECLPSIYKRKYNIKTEHCSLSKKKVSTINEGKIIVIDDKNSIPIIENKLDYSIYDSDDIETCEIKEAFRKQQQFVNGDEIFSEETIFRIPKEKFQLITETIEKSNKFCYLKFDKNKILREVQSDDFFISR